MAQEAITELLARIRPITQPINPLTGPFDVTCDYEGCTRDAACITRLEGLVSIGACDEHVVMVIELVDQLTTGRGTLTIEDAPWERKRTMADEYLDSNELEAMTGTVASTWRYWASRGEGPASFRMGRRRLWRRTVVEAWLADREKSPESTL